MNNTYITIAGMKRSGSTWQANVVRLLAEKAGKSVWMGDEYDGEQRDEVTINKIHPFKRQIAERSNIVLTSYRPLSRVISSWERFDGQTPGLERVEKWMEWLVKWNLYSSHMMDFGVLRGRMTKLAEVQRLISLLPFSYTGSAVSVSEEVLVEMKHIAPPEDEFYDEETCLFHNHITSDEFKREN